VNMEDDYDCIVIFQDLHYVRLQNSYDSSNTPEIRKVAKIL